MVFPISSGTNKFFFGFHSFPAVSIPIAMESTRMASDWRSPAIPLVEVWRNFVEALWGGLPNVAAGCGKHPLFQQEHVGKKMPPSLWEIWGTRLYYIKHAEFQDGWLLCLSPLLMIFSWHVMGIARNAWYNQHIMISGFNPQAAVVVGKFQKFQISSFDWNQVYLIYWCDRC